MIFASALALSAALAAQSNSTPENFAFSCDGPWSLDGNSNLMRCSHPTIRQDDLEIRADSAQATNVEFDKNSKWTFTGNVHIKADAATLDASSAVFTFDNNKLSHGELTGTPASFTAMRAEPGKTPVRGSANKIAFDYVGKTLHLSEHVTLTRDRLVWQSCDLVYNLKTEGFGSGDADCPEKSEIRVLPAPKEGPTSATPAPAP
ncbi:MAG TPA: LptA/OstA family protein [Gammaproteobacteria bacterium]|nr:LptA/OstA family protein [Gammaproteobacteria bacterium]